MNIQELLAEFKKRCLNDKEVGVLVAEVERLTERLTDLERESNQWLDKDLRRGAEVERLTAALQQIEAESGSSGGDLWRIHEIATSTLEPRK